VDHDGTIEETPMGKRWYDHFPRLIEHSQPGDHLCCIYETEEEHRAVLTPFLRQGLERGEKVLYIVDAHTAETILGYLRDEGVDVEACLERGQFAILTRDEAYMREGVFDPQRMIALLRAETEQALAEGYPALRVSGEMTWALRGLPGAERLIEYEARLNEFLPGSQCLAICQYDRRRFDAALLLDVLRTHPIVVIGAEVYDNFYYVPPAEFLGGDRAAVELQRWEQSLVERRRAEEEVERRNRELAALNTVAATVSQSLDLRKTLAAALDAALEATSFEAGGIALWDEKEQRLQQTITRGAEPELTAVFVGPPRTGGHRERLLRTGQPVFHDDTTHDPTVNPEIARRGFTISGMVPLVHQARVLGLLAVATRAPRRWTEEDKSLLTAVGQQIAVAVANAQLYEETQHSEEKYRNLVNTTNDLIFTVDVEGNILFANPAAKAFTGYESDETIGHHFSEYVHPDDFPILLAGIQQVLSGEPLESIRGIGQAVEHRMRKRDGQIVWVQTRGWPVRDAQGKIAGFSAITRDVTDFKRAEEALRRRAEELAALQATVLEIIARHDLPTLLQTIVERAARLLHAPGGGMYLCDPDRQEARCVVSYNTPHDYTGKVLKYGEGAAGIVVQTGEPLIIDDYRTWNRRAAVYEEDHPFRAVLSAPMIWQGQVTGVIHVLHYVEGKRFTEADLELLTLFANHAAIAIENARLFTETERRAAETSALLETSLALNSLDLDSTLRTIGEHAKALFAADGCHIFLLEPDGETLRCALALHQRAEAVLAMRPKLGQGVTGDVARRGEAEIVNDMLGDPRSIQVPGTPVEKEAMIFAPLKERERVIGVMSVSRLGDARSFRPADLELLKAFASMASSAISNARLFGETRQLKEFNQSIVQSMAEGIAIEDADGYFTFVNPAAAEMLGYTPEELVGQNWTAITPPDQHAIVQAADERRVRGESDRYELELVRKDGGRLSVWVSGSPRFEDGHFAGTLAVFTDITERKRAEEELRQSHAKLQKAFEGTVSVLVSSIEIRDPYTGNHQRRVTQLACAIAKEMGLPEEQIEGLRMAGLIHDLGKITIPAEILSKPGRLNDLQWGMIKAHPQVGYDILKAVEFPWPVAEIVLQHHERLEGSGYPQGLSGEEIKLEARIMAVATCLRPCPLTGPTDRLVGWIGPWRKSHRTRASFTTLRWWMLA